MKIKKLQIQNYKSLVDLEIIEPNPFTVFAGPNGAGKSNIFEAISFNNTLNRSDKRDSSASEIVELFGGAQSILPRIKSLNGHFIFRIFDESGYYQDSLSLNNFLLERTDNAIVGMSLGMFQESPADLKHLEIEEFIKLLNKHSRIFIGNEKIKKYNTLTSIKINEDASNLENVLSRIFDESISKKEIIEWMEIFVPNLQDVIIDSSSLSGKKEILFKEKGNDFLFQKELISDGTYNILCLLAAVYQSDSPQFLCIEEPENGLNPYVIKTLVEFFRKQCAEKGHYIWLNTHSQTLVKHLNPEELILVDKVDGATQIKQFPKGYNLQGLELDEAWLSNALGGGVPW